MEQHPIRTAAAIVTALGFGGALGLSRHNDRMVAAARGSKGDRYD